MATRDPKKQIKIILKKLKPLYKEVPLGVDFETPFQLVVGVILSAQCTDERVNLVTATFFDRLRTPEDFLKLTQTELEKLIHSTGFFRNKAKSILGCAARLVTDFDSQIPQTMEELITLPGFGRKTANVILTQLHGKNEGICVDTHVMRLSRLLGVTKAKTAVPVEKDLMKITPQKNWDEITHVLIWHGRRVCVARRPKCMECVLFKDCPSSQPKDT